MATALDISVCSVEAIFGVSVPRFLDPSIILYPEGCLVLVSLDPKRHRDVDHPQKNLIVLSTQHGNKGRMAVRIVIHRVNFNRLSRGKVNCKVIHVQ